LFPAASEDPDLADEYRRLAQQDLADGKLADLRRVMRILDRTGSGHSEVVIDDDESMALLRALNDVRIVLADRLGLQRDGDFDTVRMLQQIGEQVEGDRKSTRLNSSHVSISYAVFCLKKKKRQK